MMVEPAAMQSKADLRVIKMTRQDLPLSCPRPTAEVWNLHPRVFLVIEEDGTALCPYCGTRYLLED